jgi:septum site-determining protein MinC
MAYPNMMEEEYQIKMENPVVIKANNFGLLVVLDPDLEFEELKKAVAGKFGESRKFFGDAEMALAFSGRKLSDKEEDEILSTILSNVDFKIACIVDNDPIKEKEFKQKLDLLERINDISQAKIYKGSFRSGQMMNFETGVVILGDINPGAKVISNGSIIVLGSLRGEAEAGMNGNEDAFIIALDMHPLQARIGGKIARSPDGSRMIGKNYAPQVAFVENDAIYVDDLDKKVLSSLRIPE